MGPLRKAYLKPRIPLLFHLSIVGHSTLPLFKGGRGLQKLKIAIFDGLYWRMSKIAKVVMSKKGGPSPVLTMLSANYLCKVFWMSFWWSSWLFSRSLRSGECGTFFLWLSILRNFMQRHQCYLARFKSCWLCVRCFQPLTTILAVA